jgi:subtilase family serine protease
VPSTAALSTYYLIACADYQLRIPENNEANNCAVSTTTVVVTLPDLVQSALANPPATAAPGAAFTVADTVLNQGTIEIASTTTRYYLSLNATLDAGDVLLSGTRSIPVLGAGAQSAGSRSVTVPVTTPPGVYYLLVCADDLVRRVELDETNNCRAALTTITIGQ